MRFLRIADTALRLASQLFGRAFGSLRCATGHFAGFGLRFTCDLFSRSLYLILVHNEHLVVVEHGPGPADTMLTR